MTDLLIDKPTVFLVEEKGFFGRFFFPDKTQSRPFHTKWQAKQFVYSMKDVEFDDASVKMLIEMIENTSLQESNEELENWSDEKADIEAKVKSGCNPEV
jgi:competence transcription factor ComK